MIVFDASTLVGAAINRNSTPGRAFAYARQHSRLALSEPTYGEISKVLHRPRLARFIDPVSRDDVLNLLVGSAIWFNPVIRITDCRDAKDNIYLELALAAGVDCIISSDSDLLVLNPWRGIKILTPSAYCPI